MIFGELKGNFEQQKKSFSFDLTIFNQIENHVFISRKSQTSIILVHNHNSDIFRFGSRNGLHACGKGLYCCLLGCEQDWK